MNNLHAGLKVRSGNFELTEKITSFEDLYQYLKTHKTIFARHKVYASAFYLRWQIALCEDWVSKGYFWKIKDLRHET